MINNSLLAPSVQRGVSDIQGRVEQYLHYHLSDLLHLSTTKQLTGEDAPGAWLESHPTGALGLSATGSCGETRPEVLVLLSAV